jgi:hypothetical protein
MRCGASRFGRIDRSAHGREHADAVDDDARAHPVEKGVNADGDVRVLQEMIGVEPEQRRKAGPVVTDGGVHLKLPGRHLCHFVAKHAVAAKDEKGSHHVNT